MNQTGLKVSKKFISAVILIVIAYGAGLLSFFLIFRLNSVQDSNSNSATSFLSLSPASLTYLNEVKQKLEQNYLGNQPAESDIRYALVKGLISSLNDKYTSYLNPEEAQEYFKSASGDLDGIGITLKHDDDYTQIETVLKSNPAEKSGLKVNDVILKVDDIDMKGKQSYEVAEHIRGKAGTTVKLSIYRESTRETKDYMIQRERIELDNIEWEKTKDGYAHIKIRRFTEESLPAFNGLWDRIVNEVVATKPKGLIVDLRGNPGGYVAGVQYIAEDILKGKVTIFAEEEKSGRKTYSVDERNGKLESLPIIVLVDEGSASASEILSAAIQDNKRGKVVGQKTVGKGVEQTLLNTSDNGLLIVVHKRWLTPSGKNITAESPITPDYIVEYGSSDNDLQLAKAIELLNSGQSY